MATKVKRGRHIPPQPYSDVPTIHAKDAFEFLDAISPRSRLLRPSFYIFRGLASERYALVPAALRATKDIWSVHFAQPRTMREQIQAELKVLYNFYAVADRHGLLPPDTGSHLVKQLDPDRREGLVDQIERGQALWLPDGLLYLAAVAQHYGVPTRLLDWTQNPYIAAYFAARDAVLFGQGGASRIVVWALYKSWFGFKDDAPASLGEQKAGSRQWPRALRLISVSAAGNTNLQAQQGLFTLFRPEKIDLDGPIDRRPLDEFIPRGPGMYNSFLYRFTLPSKEAGRLLEQLSNEGVYAATLFPGLAGAVQALREYYLSVNHPYGARSLRR